MEFNINNNAKCEFKKLLSLLKQTKNSYFNNFGRPQSNKIMEIYNRKQAFPMLRANFENIAMYEYRLNELYCSSGNNLNLIEMTWIFNMTKELLIGIEDYFKKFNIETLSEFNQIVKLVDYKFFSNIEDEIFNDIIDKRLNMTKKNFQSLNDGKKLYNFIISIRNFLIHPNSKKYDYVMFWDVGPIQNLITFKNRLNYKSFFDFTVNINLPILYLNHFLAYILDNKPKIKLELQKNISSKFKTLDSFQTLKQIHLYLTNVHLISDFIFGLCSSWYSAEYFYDAYASQKKFEELAINISKISYKHYTNDFFDIEFNNYIGDFYDEFLKIIEMSLVSRGSYALEQMEHFPDIFENIVGREKYQYIMKLNKSVKLHQNLAAIVLKKRLKNDINFISTIKKYCEFVAKKEKNFGFKKFMEFNKQI